MMACVGDVFVDWSVMFVNQSQPVLQISGISVSFIILRYPNLNQRTDLQDETLTRTFRCTMHSFYQPIFLLRDCLEL